MGSLPNVLILDLETKVHRYGTGKHDIDGSPYNPNNRIVSAHWRRLGNDGTNFTLGEAERSIFYHNEKDKPDSPEELQKALDWADYIVAHNAKFDVSYLLESGFKVPAKIWCTMIGEYIIARGTWMELSLEQTAVRRSTSLKKAELVQDLFYSGVGYEEMPLDIVIEYADADVLSCAEIFIQQWEYFNNNPESGKLINIVDLMNDMCEFLIEIERNGIAIDRERLQLVREEYETELAQLEKDLYSIATDVMGDTPINLNSGADISKIVYSREVIDKDLHKKVFNIGVDEWGNEQYPPFMSATKFANAVRTTTKKVQKTFAIHCKECEGKGKVRKIKKDGTPYKKDNICKFCEGVGFTLGLTGKVAGLKLIPEGPRDASVHGFKAGKDEIDRLIAQAQDKDNLQAIEFLTKKKRLNAVNTYLNSFVGGIQRWTRQDGILHPTFNQAVARTGRLSSSDPH